MEIISKTVFSICFFLSFLLVPVGSRPHAPRSNLAAVKTETPIIGILAQNTNGYIKEKFGPTYIAASYIKYIESAGGRVVPIRVDLCLWWELVDIGRGVTVLQMGLSPDGRSPGVGNSGICTYHVSELTTIRNDLSEEQLEKLFSSINGVLFPGGDANVFDSPYARTGKILFNLAKKANDAGDVFPLWGTCLGYEFLSVCGTEGQNVLSSVDAVDYTIPLNLSEGYESSRLLGSAPEEIITYLRTANVTYNHHQNCVSTDTYYSNDALKKFYKLLSTNRDKEGVKEFVSTIEARDYPFYGVQWHPEKNPFEWTSAEVINHSKQAVLVTQYVADFFVDQARLSRHRFSNKEEEDAALIYQYNPVYCDPEKSHFEQCYIFK